MDLDADLVLSVIDQESNRDRFAVSSAGAQGLMQLMPENSRKFGVDDPFDEEQNVRAGIALLQEELDRFGELPLALAAYNAGSPKVNEAIKKAGTTNFEEVSKYLKEETRDYVPSVLANYEKRKAERLSAASQAYNDDDDNYLKPRGTVPEFATAVQDLATSSNFDTLAPESKIRQLSRLYDSKKWVNDVDALLKDASEIIWKGVPYDQRPDVASFASPYLASIDGESEETIRGSGAAARNKFMQFMKQNGVHPYLFGDEVDNLFAKQTEHQIALLGAKDRGFFGTIGAGISEIARGAAEGYASAGAGAAGLFSEDAATAIREAPGEFFSEHPDFDYEIENGKVVVDSAGQPVTRYRGQVLRGIGSIFSLLGGGVGLRVAGAGTKTIGAFFGGVNGLAGMDQAYTYAKENGATPEEASVAAYASLPGSAASTALDLMIVSTGQYWVKGLTGTNRIRAAGQIGFQAGAMGAAANVAQEVGIQAGASYATDENLFSTERTALAGATGFVGAGLIGAIEGRFFKPGPPAPKPQGEVDLEAPPLAPDAAPTVIPESHRIEYRPEQAAGPEAINVAPNVSAAEQQELARRFEEFQQKSDDRMVLELDDVSKIPEGLLRLFGFDATQISPKQVAVDKRQTYVRPELGPRYEVTDVGLRIAESVQDLRRMPHPDDLESLYSQQRELIRKQGELLSEFNVTTEVTPFIRHYDELRRKKASIVQDLGLQTNPILREIGSRELKETTDALDTMYKEIFEHTSGDYERLGTLLNNYSELKDVSLKIKQLNDPEYINNLAARQREIQDLLVEQQRLSTAEQAAVDSLEAKQTAPTPFDAAIKIASPQGDRYVMPLGDKWYVVDDGGHPLTSGHFVLRDAVQQAEQVKASQSRQPIVTPVRPNRPGKGQTVEAPGDARLTPEQVTQRRREQAVEDDVELSAAVDLGPSPLTELDAALADTAPTRSRANTEAGEQSFEDVGVPRTRYFDPVGEIGEDTIYRSQLFSPDPIENTGENIKSAKQIQRDAQKVFNMIAKQGAFKRKGVLGTYFPRLQGQAYYKHSGDLNTLIHELAHGADDLLKFGDIPMGSMPGIEKELNILAPGGSGGRDKPHSYNMAEGVAEFIRSWTINPHLAASLFPETTEYFLRHAPDDFKIGLRKLGDDIRSHFGAPAIARVGTLLKMSPDSNVEALAKTMRNFFGSGDGNFEITPFVKLQKYVTNSFKPALVGLNYVRRVVGNDLLPADDPGVLARLYLGMAGKIESVLEHGLPKFKSSPTDPDSTMTGGFHEILDQFDNSSMEARDNEMKLAAIKMVSERALEKNILRDLGLAKHLKRMGPLTGIASSLNVVGEQTEEMVARKVLKEFRKLPEDVQARVNAGIEKYREWADAGLRYMVDRGRLSEKRYNEIKAENNYYVAMQRIADDVDGVDAISQGTFKHSLLESSQVLPKFKGSGKEVFNPFIALMESTARIVQETDRNYVMARFADQLDVDRQMYSDPGINQKLAQVGYKVPDSLVEPKAVPIWRNGKMEQWVFQADVKDALQNLSKRSDSFLLDLLQKPADVLRFGVSYSPQFAVRNYIRDMGDRLILSDSGTGRQARATLAAGTLLGRRAKYDEARYALMRDGGSQAGYYPRDRVDYHRAMRTAMKNVARDPKSILYMPTKLWDNYSAAVQRSETVGRLAEYQASYKKAKEEFKYDDYNAHLYAAYKARDIMDFAVAGTLMREINRVVPYSNAAIQGLKKAVKVAGKDPAGYAFRAAVFAAIPTYMTQIWNQQAGAEDEYNQLPNWRRDLFFNFKIGDDRWLSIPKPFSGALVSMALDREVSKQRGYDNSWEGFMGSAIEMNFPFGAESIALAVRPTLEVMANRDLFRDKAIVPFYEEALDLEEREVPRGTSRLGNWIQSMAEAGGLGDSFLAKRFLNARAVDHQLRGYFGNLGSLVLRASDYGREMGGRPLTWSEVAGVVRESPIYAAKDVDYVYRWTQSHGIVGNNRKLKVLRNAIEKYFDSLTPEGKDAAAERVLEVAGRLRKGIDERGVRYFGQRKARRREQ